MKRKWEGLILLLSLVAVGVLIPYGMLIPDASGELLKYIENCPDDMWCEVYIVDPTILILMTVIIPILVVIGFIVLYFPIPKRFRKKDQEKMLR